VCVYIYSFIYIYSCIYIYSFIYIVLYIYISSIKYSRHRDGIAINTKMTAGAIVQIVSIICPSRMNIYIYIYMSNGLHEIVFSW